MIQLTGLYANLVQNGSLSKFDYWWMIRTYRDVVETFSKRHYFSENYTFLLSGHKIGVSVKLIQVAPFNPFLKNGRHISPPYKNHKNIVFRFGGGIISKSVQNLIVCHLLGHILLTLTTYIINIPAFNIRRYAPVCKWFLTVNIKIK